MPNWIEGTMKLRGTQKDIKRFFSEGVEPSNWPDPKDNIDQVVNESTDDELYFEFKNEPHIVGTRRACRRFAEKPSMEMSIYCQEQAERLHKVDGLSWEEIEEIEISAY